MSLQSDGIKQFLLRHKAQEVLVTTHGSVQVQLKKRLVEALDDGIAVTSDQDGLIVIPYTAIRYLEIPK